MWPPVASPALKQYSPLTLARSIAMSGRSESWLAIVESSPATIPDADEAAEPHPDRRAEERRGSPEPAVQARRGDSADVGADVAAEGDPRAVAEKEPAEQRGGGEPEPDSSCGRESPGEAGAEAGPEHEAQVHDRGDVGEHRR